MSYRRLFYHVVWATRHRAALIDADMAEIVERSIRATAHDLDAPVHAIGVMPDHVHLAVSIPPKFSIAIVVGRMKGSSSHLLNHRDNGANPQSFAWQAEYGVLSFSERALPEVNPYVNNQPAHHAEGRLWRALEHADDPKPPGPQGKQPA